MRLGRASALRYRQGLSPGMGDILSDAWNGMTQAASDAWNAIGSDAGQIAQAMVTVFGFPGGNLELAFFTDAFGKGQIDPSHLWTALGKDYDTFVADGHAADALTDGDYTRAWNLATSNGANLSALSNLHLEPSPAQPKPDPKYNAAQTVSDATSSKRDMRGAAQELYDHGYYTQGNALMAQWRKSLVNSPVGMLGQAMRASSEGKPVVMFDVANFLDAAAKDPSVIAQWRLNKWGTPTSTSSALSSALRSKATAAARLASMAPHAMVRAQPARAPVPVAVAARAPAAIIPAPVLAAAVAPPASSGTGWWIAGGVGLAALAAAALVLRKRSRHNPRRRRRCR